MVGQLFTPTFSKEDYAVGLRSSGESHGVVMTKPHVVSLILDLAGYSPEKNLAALTLLEPSCGKGAFLVEVVERLIDSARQNAVEFADLKNAILATDLDESHVTETRNVVATLLREKNVPALLAAELVECWVVADDFLLRDFSDRRFDFVVGNPPYIRIEQLSRSLLAEYRCRFESMSDRADLYVPFIEKSLELLKPKGTLTFICADRWTTNRYGGKLREMVTKRYALNSYIQLDHNAAFESEVSAYPSVFSIGRQKQGVARVYRLGDAAEDRTAELAQAIRTRRGINRLSTQYQSWFSGSEPWLMIEPNQLETLKDLESRFIPIEQYGDSRIRIGIATGADKIYIVNSDADIEASRLVPLLQRKDLRLGRIDRPVNHVINTSEPEGGSIDLDAYPRLKRYFDQNIVLLKKRHVAEKDPKRWFKTIDRLHDNLISTPKLIVPDIAGSTEVFLETGGSYPHHNLYFITSTEWDLEVLGGILSSRVALFFIWCYAVKMRGGYLRFQAQYLRKIRVPDPSQLDATLQLEIAASFRARDFEALDKLSLNAYGLECLPEFPFKDTRY